MMKFHENLSSHLRHMGEIENDAAAGDAETGKRNIERNETLNELANAINVPVVKFHSSIWRQVWFDVIHFEWRSMVWLPSAIPREQRIIITIINEHENNKWNVMSWRVRRNRCQSASVHCNSIRSAQPALGAHIRTHICNYKM